MVARKVACPFSPFAALERSGGGWEDGAAGGKISGDAGEVFPGRTDAYWDSANAKNAENGAFEWATGRMGVSVVFKVEAEGYAPFVSEAYKATQENYSATFKLVGK